MDGLVSPVWRAVAILAGSRTTVRGSITSDSCERKSMPPCRPHTVEYTCFHRVESNPIRDTSDMFHSKQLHQSENEESWKAPNGGHDDRLIVRRACSSCTNEQLESL